ncbi:MAG TPA: efflux RND transporter periplasmic adaptor subunit [Polyangia bacterium]|nr:efflux RND transporter periplasmic adaptor subunit [Polyangia bacterium]
MKAGLRVVSLAVCLASCHGGRTEPDVAPRDEVWLSAEQIKKANIQIVPAEEVDLPQAVTAGGRVAFDDAHVTRVYSPVTGRVTRVLANPGQRVKKGTPLLGLASPDVGQAFADVVKAQADLAAAEAENQRQARLFEAGASSAREREQAEDTFRTARAEYQRTQKRAQLLRAGGDVVSQEYTLKSYIEGEIISRSVNPGVEVQGQYAGGAAAELFVIGDIARVWVFADVADVDLPRVRLGADVEVRALAYPGRVFHGKVDWISSTVDPALRTGRVRCSLANEHEELKPEMLATVSIVQSARRQLTIPHDALVRINETSFTFVAGGARPDGRLVFKRRVLRTGEEQSGLVPVLDGLAPGERVVNEGSLSREQPNDEVWPTDQQLHDAGITVAIAREQDVPNAVSIGGRLAFDDLRVSHVFSPVNGRVTKVLAELGQRVRKGTPLLALSSPDVGQFVADVVKAEASLTAAEHEYQRQKDLYAYAAPVHAGTLKDLEAAEDAWRKARAEADRAREKARLLQAGSVDAVTQDYVLRSPIDGEVIARTASPGLEVQGQYTIGGNVAELFTIGAVDKLWLLGDVYEMDRPRVNEGDEVVLRLGGADKTFHGVVDWVSDVLDPVLHTARVRCVIDNPERLLRPEMYEAVKISVPAKDVLAVPRQAVLRLGSDTFVFVATGQKRPDGASVFKRRQVVVNDQIEGDVVPVLGGLRAGESVAVTHAVLLLGML